MITYVTGDIFDSSAEALVNPVNTVGVMGKGLARQFKERYPGNYLRYKEACAVGQVRLGRMLITPAESQTGPRLIVNFPTKQHWKDRSHLYDIRAGLIDLVRVIRKEHIRSIAVPALGAGLGGLDWSDVRPLIAASLGQLQSVQVEVFEPTTTEAPK